MKAAVRYIYGPPSSITLEEIEKPVPGPDEVLVRVQASSFNGSDWEFLVGTPLYSRVMGVFAPRFKILGSDIAGRVEAVGARVSEFKPGDEVFGDIMGHFGGFAEYVCAPAKKLRHKPAKMSFEEVATIPQAAVIALQGLRYGRPTKRGDHVLINGAGGGSGSFAIQMAKSVGATVTAVDHGGKLEFMRSLGADHVLDCARDDFTQGDVKYDLILDLVAQKSIHHVRRVLAPQGRYAVVGGAMTQIFQSLLLGPLLSLWGGQKLGLLAVEASRGDFEQLEAMFEARQIRTTIDRVFSLDETIEAFRYFGDGKVLGKIVLTM